MNVFNKRAQSSMEFLITYGWAIMAFIIAISAFYYFGGNILKAPSGDERCIFEPGFYCKDFKVTTTGVNISVKNSLGINVKNLIVNITDVQGISCINSTSKGLNDGSYDFFYVYCTPDIKIGNAIKGKVVIQYNKENSVLQSVSRGSINGKSNEIGPAQPIYSCKGTATPCDQILSEMQCNTQVVCLWEDLVPPFGCKNYPGATPCESFTTQTSCQYQLGCSWTI